MLPTDKANHWELVSSPLSLLGWHPPTVCLSFFKVFTLFLIVQSPAESMPLSIEMSEHVDKNSAKKRGKHQRT